MGRAAASRGEIRAALDELEFHWGSAYHIAVVDGMYTARRTDGKGVPLADPLVAAIGCQFHLDYGVVLRALLFAADRHQARLITGATGSAGPGGGSS